MRSPAMHHHDFFECFLVLEGNRQHLTPDATEVLAPNQLHFVRPEHAHCIQGQAGSADLVFLNTAFEASVFDAVQGLASWPPACWRSGSGMASLRVDDRQRHALTEAVGEAARDPSGRNAAWLLLSLARIVTEAAGGPSAAPGMPAWLAEGLARASDSEVLVEGVPALTRLMGRSRKHIARSFRTYLGLTPTEWLLRERIQRACLLLSTTGLSVLEIALDCGFESPSYFHKCFQEQMHTTPLKYRKSLSRVQV
ncbi:MAG: helix-turn-helix domain-containing protein [Opitutales bacterium]